MNDGVLFAIIAIDGPDTADLRKRYFPEHREYLADYDGPITYETKGPLLGGTEPDALPIGSLFIVQAPGLSEVEQFHQDDPFYKNGVWAESRIYPYIKRS